MIGRVRGQGEDRDVAREAGVSEEAAALWRSCEVIDLHVDALLGATVRGYDLADRHAHPKIFGGKLFGHLDLPRALEAGLTGAMWSVVTNPMRTPLPRLRHIERSFDTLRRLATGSSGRMRLVARHADFHAARRDGAHAAMLAIQGGNCFDGAPESVERLAAAGLLRVTLVHLTRSSLGETSSPLGKIGGDGGRLTKRGKDLVARLDDARVFVDLAHAGEQTFWDVVEAHDRARPLIVTHTGVSGVRVHWRNIDDAQLRAVADSGGVVGVMFQASFLKRDGGPANGRMVVEHLAHVCDVAGEGVAALGSDYDGAIVPPDDMADATLAYVRLVQHMLDAGFTEARIRAVLGGNFLKALERLRP